MGVPAQGAFAHTGRLAFAGKPCIMPSPSRIPRGYRAITVMVREQDAAEMKRIAESLRSEGWTHASASFVHRAACVVISDALRGKSAEEILRFFVDYRASRAQLRTGTAAAPNRLKA